MYVHKPEGFSYNTLQNHVNLRGRIGHLYIYITRTNGVYDLNIINCIIDILKYMKTNGCLSYSQFDFKLYIHNNDLGNNHINKYEQNRRNTNTVVSIYDRPHHSLNNITQNTKYVKCNTKYVKCNTNYVKCNTNYVMSHKYIDIACHYLNELQYLCDLCESWQYYKLDITRVYGLQPSYCFIFNLPDDIFYCKKTAKYIQTFYSLILNILEYTNKENTIKPDLWCGCSRSCDRDLGGDVIYKTKIPYESRIFNIMSDIQYCRNIGDDIYTWDYLIIKRPLTEANEPTIYLYPTRNSINNDHSLNNHNNNMHLLEYINILCDTLPIELIFNILYYT